ncbi:hypothetical protein FDH82_gp61 [Roseobacter phage RDJL Phi 2]|uniref:Uncharacterized protein n=1 Tax=Roseobacter phage RDJL Phi 2 TaxID=1682380 RepID=A0A0K0PVJ1_9CAUD|nr:hypothetical protein FDH82_gp61 [Roseobacter phage RDJL Phi 2]AKQ75851.1 hypothetical protein RDJLphi2_gp61 [Roseobacter phage RDJL Phi 2]
MPADRKKRTALKIAEISGVDVPAQEGAKALIMKRHEPVGDPIVKGSKEDVHDERGKMAKSAALTTEMDGHTHLIYTSGPDGDWDAGTTSWHDEHSHPWVRTPDGAIVLGEAKGHTHMIAAVTKAVELQDPETAGSAGSVVEKEATMPNDKTKVEPTVEDLQKQLARQTSVAELTDVQKAHFGTLDETAQDVFLAKSADDRQAEVDTVAKNAADADPVVYKTLDGLELRKSAGDALIAMAKSNDTLRKQNDELAKNAANETLRKRAETELAHLPGDVDARMALIKSVDGIEDKTQREAAMNALKAQNEAMAKAFKTAGHGGEAPVNSATEQLDALAKAHAEANPGTSFAKAYDAVLETAKGAELYAQSLN